MIKILDSKTETFLNFLNEKYGTEEECILSVLNLTDCVTVDADGNTVESCFVDDADLIMLSTEAPLNGIFDCEGKPAPKFYEDNYTILKLAHEYGHFLQKYGKLDNPTDEIENEKVADTFAKKVVKEFLAIQ